MLSDQRLRQVELAFLNAPFVADGWIDAIRQLADLTGSAVTQLCGGGPDSLSFNHFSRELHDPHGHLTNPDLYGLENWRINCTQTARTIQYERHYAAYREVNPARFYDDAVSDLDLPFGCQSPLMLDANGLVGLALLRSSRDGQCTPEVIGSFTRVARQAHRAVRAQLGLGREMGDQMLSALGASGEMTLLLDRNGQLVTMTEAAESLFDCPIGLRLDGLAVRLANDKEDRAFRAAIGRLLGSEWGGGPIVHEARVGRCESQPEGWWRLFLTRLPAGQDLLGLSAHLALTLRPVVTSQAG